MTFKTRYGDMPPDRMVVYDDPNPAKEVKVKYKGRSAIGAGAFYCPHIPLQSVTPLTQRLARKRQKDTFPWRLRAACERLRDRVERATGRIWRSLVRKSRS